MKREELPGIQWYPGHMTKTRRMMEEQLKLVDAVCELLDARIPVSSRNPDIAAICGAKPRLVVLNRADLADPDATARWIARFRAEGLPAIRTDCKSPRGVAPFAPAVRSLLAEKLRRYAEKGQAGRPLKLMVVGVPNVGKSTFINQLSGRRGAKAENRPGVTRGKQWVTVSPELLLLDTPGILWPRFEDPAVGVRLAWTGAVKEDILDIETLGCGLAAYLAEFYGDAFRAAYRLEALPARQAEEGELAFGVRLLEAAGRRRGFLVSGGAVDTERMAKCLLDEFRAGRLGRLTLEQPERRETDGSLGN